MRAKFIQIPVELLDDPAISAVEFRLYSILLRYGLEGRGFSQAGTALLAKNCKCCQQTITRSLKNLASAGYISIERIGLNRNNRIRCHRTVKRDEHDNNNAQKRKSSAGRISQKSFIKKNEECAIIHCSDIKKKQDRRPVTPSASVLKEPQRPTDTRRLKATNVFKEETEALQARLQQFLRPASYNQWFKDVVVLNNDPDRMELSLGHQHIDWVEDNYRKLLKRITGKDLEILE